MDVLLDMVALLVRVLPDAFADTIGIQAHRIRPRLYGLTVVVAHANQAVKAVILVALPYAAGIRDSRQTAPGIPFIRSGHRIAGINPDIINIFAGLTDCIFVCGREGEGFPDI